MKWLVLLLIIPFASAGILPTNCATAPVDHGECQNILSDTSLSLTEKEDLYLNLLNSQSELPSHDFVWNWNTHIAFNSPPIGLMPTNNGVIQDAWLKIVGVNKSVFDLNQQKWFVQPTGQVLVAKNYSLNTPSGTLPGECQTTYSTNTTQNQLLVKANGQPIGTNTISTFSLDLPDQSDLNFKTEWNLAAQVTTNHYQNRLHCVGTLCWNQCDFINSTTDNSSVQLRDELPAKVLVVDYSILTALDNSSQQPKILVKINSNEPLNQFELVQNDKRFSKSTARFDIDQTLAPYDALFITRQPEQKISSSFLILNETSAYYELATSSSQDCELKITTDFTQEQRACNAISLTPTRIELSTDQNQFDQNETIHLAARLLDDQNQAIPNKTLDLASKNQRETVTTNESGLATWAVPAASSNGVFTANFASDLEFAQSQATQRISIADSQTSSQVFNVFTFFFGYFFLFAAFKRKMGFF